MSMELENEVHIKLTPADPDKSFRSKSDTSLDGEVNTVKLKLNSIMVNHSNSVQSGIQSQNCVEIGLNATRQFFEPKPVRQFTNFKEPVPGYSEYSLPESNQSFPKKYLDGTNHKVGFSGFLKSTRDKKVILKSMQNFTVGSNTDLKNPTNSPKIFTMPNEHPMMHIVRFFWNMLLLIFRDEISVSNFRA